MQNYNKIVRSDLYFQLKVYKKTVVIPNFYIISKLHEITFWPYRERSYFEEFVIF
jgi:hypothetical protein